MFKNFDSSDTIGLMAIVGLALIVIGILVGAIHSDFRRSQIGVACVENGGQWIEDSCVKDRK